MENIELKGKFVISGKITAFTGLHIGGSSIGMSIGGADNIILRDVITNMPYIPGSSIKGKMRSLLEKKRGKVLNYVVKKSERRKSIMIHFCESKEEYDKCEICNIFGNSSDKFAAMPTRIIVRDALMDDSETNLLSNNNTDMPYTEVKTEVVIDRITSKATPRQIERVPAGAEFDFEIIYDIYNNTDYNWFNTILEGMKLLEFDSIGGSGSRGYGKIKFGKYKRDEKALTDELEEGIEIKWLSSDYFKNLKEADILINKTDKVALDKIPIDIKDKIKK
jgi:CRISPR-associated protein Csm3